MTSGEEIELTGPIVQKSNDDKRLAYAAVLVPNELDHDGESVTKERIEEAAHEWLRSYRNVDLQHTLNNVAIPVESYITPTDLKTEKGVLPAGTWILASKITDDSVWEAVKTGKLSGYSVMGIKRTNLESSSKSLEEASLKKTLLRDLGDDWVAVAVSVVDEPAVPKAKFFAIKSSEGGEEKGLAQRLKDVLMPSSEKAGRKISEANYKKLTQVFDTLKEILEVAEEERMAQTSSQALGAKQKGEESTMEKEEIAAMVNEAVKEVFEPLKAELQEQFASLKEQGQEQEPEAGEEENKQPEGDLEALKKEFVERFDKVEKMLAKRVSAKSLSGQDGEGAEIPKAGIKGRDSFGRRVRE